MQPDPNWFHSSLAQSVAAIVGIVGGFILTAVLRQRDNVAQYRLELVRNARNAQSRWRACIRGRQAFLNWSEQYAKDENTYTTAAPVPITALDGTSEQPARLSEEDIADIREFEREARSIIDQFGDLDTLLNADRKDRPQHVADLEARSDTSRVIESRANARKAPPFAHDGYSTLHGLREDLGHY